MSDFLSKFKGGGGFITEGAVTDVNWVEGYPFGDRNSGEDQVYLTVDIQPDGADEPIKKAFWFGQNTYVLIEDEGKVLRSKDENGDVDEERTPTLYVEGEAYKLVAALEEHGFPVDSTFLPIAEESNALDFRGLIGWRLRFTEEKVLGDGGKPLMGKPKKKGKHKGKSFAVTQTQLTKVLSPPVKGVKSSKTTKKAAKTADIVESDENDSDGIDIKTADKFLKEVLKSQGKDGSILREKLTLAVTRTLSAKKMDLNEHAELRKYVTSEDYLTDAADRGVVEFDPTARKQEVSLAA